ncbi:uncharacterized protein CLUP02_06310 [Colletotrichum lupini]|uniref:Uncharacterized protein n=1 Tax=Colletotrichum lupini TaxID=145971 RepID=A0A9Q8WFL1_9PEZI|nr:uncharacterized protein CLUP02_06310 [Colletotrichum lupini]UQC80825.1 hypothetical protein CLUP02_06310 [Colletotrichum lupini]
MTPVYHNERIPIREGQGNLMANFSKATPRRGRLNGAGWEARACKSWALWIIGEQSEQVCGWKHFLRAMGIDGCAAFSLGSLFKLVLPPALPPFPTSKTKKLSTQRGFEQGGPFEFDESNHNPGLDFPHLEGTLRLSYTGEEEGRAGGRSPAQHQKVNSRYDSKLGVLGLVHRSREGKKDKKLSVDPAEDHHSYVTGSAIAIRQTRPEWALRHLGPPHTLTHHQPSTVPSSPARLSSRHKDVQRTANLLQPTAPTFLSAAMFLVPGASLTTRTDRSLRLGEGRPSELHWASNMIRHAGPEIHAPSFSPSYEDTPLGESGFSESFFHRVHRAHHKQRKSLTLYRFGCLGGVPMTQNKRSSGTFARPTQAQNNPSIQSTIWELRSTVNTKNHGSADSPRGNHSRNNEGTRFLWGPGSAFEPGLWGAFFTKPARQLLNECFDENYELPGSNALYTLDLRQPASIMTHDDKLTDLGMQSFFNWRIAHLDLRDGRTLVNFALHFQHPVALTGPKKWCEPQARKWRCV